MSVRTASFLAVKDLKRDKKIAMLVVFLLAFSYINITFFAAFLNGLGNTFQESVIDTSTSHIIITPSERLKYIPDVSLIRKKIELNREVTGTSARISVPITIIFGEKQFSVSATGIKPSDDSQVTTTSNFVISGSYLSDTSSGEVVLGRFIAGERIEDTIGREQFGQLIEGLGVRVGEVVTVKYSNGIQREYKVRGILSAEGFSSVSQDVFITDEEAKDVLGLEDQASSILVRLDDRYKADHVKQFILEQGIKNVDVKTWEEASSFVGAINSTFGIVIFATSLVGIIIVLVTIGIVIFINTSRKKRIIGVLKAIGMSSREVLLIFMLQSILLGTAGMLLGVGIFEAVSIYTNSNPIHLPIGDLRLILPVDSVIGAAALIIISAVIAGYVPARSASKQKILESIKTVE
ncbi:MAG: ABC transporter permease [Candidatus Aenigmarchaeota archaeon]|nr:ABC transporter permease [Candidatus Aenigmarchaeota archaeon]